MLRAIGVALGLCFATLSWAGEPRLFLSWHRPYGLPGASETLTRACGDTTRVDTLFLSFDPGRGCPTCSTFVGMTATLTFKTTPGDTLGPFWRPGWEDRLPPWARIEWAPDSSSDCPSPWKSLGMGFLKYFQVGGVGLLRMVYAVSTNDAVPVKDGHRYGLARLLFHTPRPGNPGCQQPVYIEWSQATMGYTLKEYPVEGDAKVSLNTPWARRVIRPPSAR